ncbi:MAG: hypothetical protein HFH08_02300 [Bacilli bacterium]|nr:hypothetical protein [Bacilli bacterium]
MKDNNLEVQNEIEKTAYQMIREEPEKLVETFHNKTITTIEKPSKKKKWIPIGVGVIVTVFFLLLVFIFLRIYPKYILVKSLDLWSDSFKIMESPSFGTHQYNWDKMTTKGVGTIKIGEFLTSNFGGMDNETSSLFQKLNSLSFHVESRISKEDKKAFINFNGEIEEESFLDFSYIKEDQKQYILLKEVLGTYLQLEEKSVMDKENLETEAFYEDVEYVWSILKKSVKKNIKSSYIKQKSEKIIIDGKTLSTTKISLILDENTNDGLIKKIIEDLKNDKRAYNFIINIYPEFANLVEINSEKTYQFNYSVNVTKGIPKIVKVSILNNQDNVINLIKNEDYIFEIVEKEEPLFRMITREEKNGFKIKFQVLEDNLEMILTKKKEKDSTIYNFEIEANGATMEVVSTHTVIGQEKNSYSENMKLDFFIKAQGMSLELANINLDLKTTEGAIFDEITDSKLITDLTEEEKQKINLYFQSFTNLLESSEQF